jgi:hypothetical protein
VTNVFQVVRFPYEGGLPFEDRVSLFGLETHDVTVRFRLRVDPPSVLVTVKGATTSLPPACDAFRRRFRSSHTMMPAAINTTIGMMTAGMMI